MTRSRSPFRPAAAEPVLEGTFPILGQLRRYRAAYARRDVPAGLTVAALALPSGLAYAELAGLSPVTGLYALLLPTLAYVLLGTSRQLVIGPEGSLSALVAAAVLSLAVAGSPEAGELAAMLALLVAAFFVLSWLLRLDWIADYFSRPVLVGYLHGVAVVLIVGQLEKLLGLSVDDGSSAFGAFADTLFALPDASAATTAIGVAALGVLLLLRFVAPRIPAALIVVVTSIAVSWAIDLASHGVAVVGTVPGGLPSLGIPTPAFRDTLELVFPALGIFLVCFADEVLTARSFAGRHGQHIRARQELLAMGAANAGSGFSGAFPVGASGSRTAVNDAMGARTQVAGIVAATTVVIVLLFLTDPISYLPTAVLGAVIISAAIGLIDRTAWRSLWTTDRVEFTIAAVTMAGVVLIGVLEALAVAVGLSIVDVVRRSARPHDAVLGWVERLGRWGDVAVHPTAETTPGVVVYRLDDRLFFANAGYFKGRVQEAVRGAGASTRWVVLDAEAMTHIDATGIAALEQTIARLETDGVGLAVARARAHLVDRLGQAGIVERIGSDRFYPTVRAAVEGVTSPPEAGP